MKILTTINDLKNLDQLLNVSDGLILGDERFAKTLTLDLGSNMIDTIKQINNAKKEVFILLNKIYTDKELSEVKNFILSLPNDLITAYIGADIGLLETFKTLGLLEKFVYNPETLLTNDVDFNDLSNLNIKGAFVSKEITLDDIYEIGKLKKYELFYFGHGHMSMFYSKRMMLQTFSDYQNKTNNLHFNKNLRLSEAKRPNESYPILEDTSGTHVFRGYVLNSFDAMDKLNEVVDYFIVDTLLLDDAYALEVIPMYKNIKLDENVKIKLLETYNQTWHEGFLFDESTIKGEKK
ncbi:U32 family peptidase [Acholeplasma granularum]|uniref:U32 family peptidase n=1 Tax=Acholeplasma granularum TaxID=264635 RepID=UPI0004B7159C|nr:U32 family peptidase [Acholeplasma granularum]